MKKTLAIWQIFRDLFSVIISNMPRPNMTNTYKFNLQLMENGATGLTLTIVRQRVDTEVKNGKERVHSHDFAVMYARDPLQMLGCVELLNAKVSFI